MSRKKKNAAGAPGDRVAAELGLDPGVWCVGVGYSKGILSGSRSAEITVTHRPSGRKRSEHVTSAGKAAARRDAVAVVRRLVQEMGG